MYMSTEMIKSNPELRFMARQHLQGNWLNAILACLIYTLIMWLPGFVPYLGPIISLVIGGPMVLGICIFFLKFCRGQKPSLECVFDGFKYFGPAFVLMLLMHIFIFLWSLLLVIPGIIAALGYSQAFYILYDNPGIKPMDALRRSKEMMLGHRGKLFCLFLSFIGWSILCVLTCGIGYIWLMPYIQASLANFYENLRKCKESAFNLGEQQTECHCGGCCHEADVKVEVKVEVEVEATQPLEENKDETAPELTVEADAAPADTLEDPKRNMAVDADPIDTDTNTPDASDNDQSAKE